MAGIYQGKKEYTFASKNTLFKSFIDGAGMGLGFAFALTLLGGVREILGSGSIFGFKFIKHRFPFYCGVINKQFVICKQSRCMTESQ